MKQVVVHLGPHKTGSTAIQECLTENQNDLKQAGILFLHGGKVHEAAMLLAQEAFDEAEECLRAISTHISGVNADTVILSQEDFCGELPGRTRRKAIYPKLTKNLRIIARGLQPHRVRFVFFERDEAEWLVSCYHQHLKHRTLFSSFEGFLEHFGETPSWLHKLERPRETFGGEFVTVPHRKISDAGVRAILEVAGQPALRLTRR